jgi:acyl carrier protein
MTASETEQSIKSLWKEMLNIDDIAPDQSFFEAGGDSLQMIDMLFRAGAELGMEIDPGLLFEDPTLRGFSALVAASLQASNPAAAKIA